jgi:uncharacterized coiled-coil protein SlyX
MSEPVPATSNGQKFSRFARSPEELVFYTDTDEPDYPIYLLPNYEIRMKKRPEAQRFAVFHLRSSKTTEYYRTSDWLDRYFYVANVKIVGLDEYVRAYPQLPLSRLLDEAKALKASVAIRTIQLDYEVYKGDYEALVAEASATAVSVAVCPPFSGANSEKQMFAITYSTQKRLLAKMPELQFNSYIAKVWGRRSYFPCVMVKFCFPSQELILAFDEVKAYLAVAEAPRAHAIRPIDEEIEELERTIAEKEKELAELKEKLQELKRMKCVSGRVASLVDKVVVRT